MSTPTGTVNILMISSNPWRLAPTENFLRKRKFDVTIKSTLREAVAVIAAGKIDWVFLSVNLDLNLERTIDILRKSFNIDPILFGDESDSQTKTQLQGFGEHAMTATVTGPSVQFKISQITNERVEKFISKSSNYTPGTSGPKGMGHVILRGEESRPRVPKIYGPSGGHSSKSGAPKTAAENQTSIEKRIEEFHVMISEQAGRRGYVLMGLTAGEAKEIQKSNGKLIGPIDPAAKESARWEELRALMKESQTKGKDEFFSCFVPVANPLPSYEVSAADANRLNVPLEEIPAESPLPCPVYVHLPQNGKFICLIKAAGMLSQTQQQKLVKSGMKFLSIAKTDADLFSLFYVHENL